MSKKWILVTDQCQQCHDLFTVMQFLECPVVLTSLSDSQKYVTHLSMDNYLVCCDRLDRSVLSRMIVKAKSLCSGVYVLGSHDAAYDQSLFTAHLEYPIKRQQLLSIIHQSKSADVFSDLIGESKAMQQLRATLLRVANSDSTVLIHGESGTGKEVVAKIIHRLSHRSEKPFVPLNCGAIPAELIESELFGHEKGAFTGAATKRVGRFEYAHHGTLFLDEIGDMPFMMQVKLLRVLQERCFERVGGNESIATQARVLAATHRNLEDHIANGHFREDLYYRLNVFPIVLAPLRERVEDIPLLIDYFVNLLSVQYQGKITLSADAIDLLSHYAWPGNVRELANLVERLMILYPDSEIGVGQIPEKFCSPVNTPLLNAEFGVNLEAGLKQHLADIELSLIKKTLTDCDGVISQAAKQLKLGRTTLIEKMRKYQLGV